MKSKLFTTLFTLVLAASARAGSLYDIQSLEKSEAQIDMARVQANFILEKPANNNDLRISLLVVDNGGSTDVSPSMSVYLTFWKDGEMRNIASAFKIIDTFELRDFKVDVKKDEIILVNKVYSEHVGFDTEKTQIWYGEFLKEFRKAESTPGEDFVDVWVKGELLAEMLR